MHSLFENVEELFGNVQINVVYYQFLALKYA